VTVGSALLVAVALVGTAATVFLALNLINVLVTLLLSVILAEAIRPGVVALQRARIPRPLAILAIYLAIIGCLSGSVALLAPPLANQIRDLARDAPTYVEQIRAALPGLAAALEEVSLLDPLQGALGRLDAAPILRGVAGIPAALFGGLFNILGGLVLAGFWLGLTETADRDVIARLPARQRTLVRELAHDLSLVWGGWLRGQLALMAFVGAISFVGLVVLRVPYPVALAVWAGVTEIFPIIGPWIGGVPAVLLAALVNPALGLAVFVLYLGVQQLENNLLVPKVMQRAVGLHPFVVLLALLVGGTLLGFVGIVIAVPLAAGLQVLAVRLWLRPLIGPPDRIDPETASDAAEPAAPPTAPAGG